MELSMCEEQGGELKPIRPYREPFSIDKEEGQVHTQLYCGTGYKYKCMHKDIGRVPCFFICILTYTNKCISWVGRSFIEEGGFHSELYYDTGSFCKTLTISTKTVDRRENDKHSCDKAMVKVFCCVSFFLFDLTNSSSVLKATSTSILEINSDLVQIELFPELGYELCGCGLCG